MLRYKIELRNYAMYRISSFNQDACFSLKFGNMSHWEFLPFSTSFFLHHFSTFFPTSFFLPFFIKLFFCPILNVKEKNSDQRQSSRVRSNLRKQIKRRWWGERYFVGKQSMIWRVWWSSHYITIVHSVFEQIVLLDEFSIKDVHRTYSNRKDALPEMKTGYSKKVETILSRTHKSSSRTTSTLLKITLLIWRCFYITYNYSIDLCIHISGWYTHTVHCTIL